jgi:hypothetical protein
MSIAGYEAPRETVKRPDGVKFSVRALTLEDITILMRNHYAPIASLFDKYVVREVALQAAKDGDAGPGLDLDISEDVLVGILEQAPQLIAEVIARAAEEPDQAHLVKMFSVGTQLEAVLKIVTLTLEAEGGGKKLIGSVMMLVKGLTSASPEDQQT